MPDALVSDHPLVRHKLRLLRDEATRPQEFRRLVHEISELLGVAATQDLDTHEIEVRTPMGPGRGDRLVHTPALVPILRAGLGMADGLSHLMPQAEIWHLGIYRDEVSLEPVEYYNKLPPEAPARTCLLLDPMLATGGSAVAAVDTLKRWGVEDIRFLCLIGATQGIETLHGAHPDVPIHLAGLDEKLDRSGYIVPGLGDAGDRQFRTGSRRATVS